MNAFLACSKILPINQITLPKMASYKLDGIRALAIDGIAMSRNGKPIPNKFIQSKFKEVNLNGLDGELMLVGPEADFNDMMSAIMSYEGEPDFYYAVFDSTVNLEKAYTTRHVDLQMQVLDCPDWVKLIEQHWVHSEEYLAEIYAKAINLAYEGLILRDPHAPYKQGRSTEKQQWMLKLKPLEDMEGTIVGFDELEHNLDTSTKKKENMISGNTLGAFIVEFGSPDGNQIVKVGTGKGLTSARRKEFWEQRNELLGKQVTVVYQELSRDGIPRFPRFKGFRNE